MTVDPRRDLAGLGFPTENASRLATCPAKSRSDSFPTEDAR